MLQLGPNSARERNKEQKFASKDHQETQDHLGREVGMQSAYLCLDRKSSGGQTGDGEGEGLDAMREMMLEKYD